MPNIRSNLSPKCARGYIYDAETGFYYLQSRYYDPTLGRFINADAFASTGQGILGNNMFAYCGNNPVNCVDSSGQFPCAILGELKQIVRGILHAGNSLARDIGLDTAAIGAGLLDMYESSDGIYHASVDCWQQYFGYNKLYDLAFDFGTSMATSNFAFTHDGAEYIIWVWKGDYINLGAGAEMGIYYGGGPHWRVDTSLAMPMTLSLNYNGTNILSHSASTWWITGFNSNYQNVQASALTASFSIDFSNNPNMYDSFYSVYYGMPGWTFNKNGNTASFAF